MGLAGAGGLTSVEFVVGFIKLLDWLDEAASQMHPKKKDRFLGVCSQIRLRLDWEFGHHVSGQKEPTLNIEALIADFTYFAIELDDIYHFESVSEEQLRTWEGIIEELYVSISESNLSSELRYALLDLISSIRQAVRDLRRFGAVSSQERLADAVGRVVKVWKPASTQGGDAFKWLKEGVSLIAEISKVSESLTKISALGAPIIQALEALNIR